MIEALPARQHGVVARWQLIEVVPRWDVDHRSAERSVHQVHRGVYALVRPRLLRREGHWMAAVLACGPDAVLSHAAAAALWDLRR